MMEQRTNTEKDIYVLCHGDLVQIYRIYPDGPPPLSSRYLALPWDDVTHEYEDMIKKVMRSFVSGLNMYSKVEEVLQCHVHAD